MKNQNLKKYHPPKLEIYGNVSKLTQGGSSGTPETAMNPLGARP